MLKYKVGTRLRHKFAPTATYIVADFRMANPMQYLLSGLSEYHTPTWVSEDDIPDFMDVIDETNELQAENERLKVALGKLFTVSFYYSNGIECKRCAQRAATPQAVVHLSWCEVGEAKDMLKNEVNP